MCWWAGKIRGQVNVGVHGVTDAWDKLRVCGGRMEISRRQSDQNKQTDRECDSRGPKTAKMVSDYLTVDLQDNLKLCLALVQINLLKQ